MMAITTFPNLAWSTYARGCLERMIENWPGSIRVYFEGSTPLTALAKLEVELRPLDEIAERTAFMNREIPHRPGFLWDVKRFSHKVFAQLDAVRDGQPFWWIDADVAIFKPVPPDLLEQEDIVTFLGRDSYTETGFIGFNPPHPAFTWFEERYRRMYTEAEILLLPCWTDCHAFDHARGGRGTNLTPNGKGFDNVMEQSAFGGYMTHFKGPLKANLYRLGGARAVSADLRLD